MRKLIYIAAFAASTVAVTPAFAQASTAPNQTSSITCVDGYKWDVARDGFVHYEGRPGRVPCEEQVIYQNTTNIYVRERVDYGYSRPYYPSYYYGGQSSLSAYRQGRRDEERRRRERERSERLRYPHIAQGGFVHSRSDGYHGSHQSTYTGNNPFHNYGSNGGYHGRPDYDYRDNRNSYYGNRNQSVRVERRRFSEDGRQLTTERVHNRVRLGGMHMGGNVDRPDRVRPDRERTMRRNRGSGSVHIRRRD